MCADEVQILVPLISQPPSVLVALVLAANRSEPEFGSLMPIAKQTSPRQIRGRMSILMCSGAYFSSTGPLCRSATKNRRVGALATPHFLGHDIALEEGTLVAPIFLRPGHAVPAAFSSPPAELRRGGVISILLTQ